MVTSDNAYAEVGLFVTVCYAPLSYAVHLQSTTTSALFHRACAMIQSAHRHYNEAISIMDGVRNPSRNMITVMLGDEQSRESTYKGLLSYLWVGFIATNAYLFNVCPSESANKAHIAQKWYTECMRILEPHMELIPQRLSPYIAELQEAGLLQPLKIYELMYGGESLGFGGIRGTLSSLCHIHSWDDDVCY